MSGLPLALGFLLIVGGTVILFIIWDDFKEALRKRK